MTNALPYAPASTSGVDIEIPENWLCGPPPPAANECVDDSSAIFRRLRWLKARLEKEKASKHDIAITLISACILEGLTTRVRIVRALRKIGLDYRHVVITLNQGTGLSATACHWWRDSDGHHHLHLDSSG